MQARIPAIEYLEYQGPFMKGKPLPGQSRELTKAAVNGFSPNCIGKYFLLELDSPVARSDLCGSVIRIQNGFNGRI